MRPYCGAILGTLCITVTLIFVFVCTRTRSPPLRSKPTLLSERALYINMRDQGARRRHAESLLRDMGFAPERVEPRAQATAWKSLSDAHKLCVEIIARDSSSRYICVFEDDVELAHGLQREKARSYIEEQLSLLGARLVHKQFVKLGACLDTDQDKRCNPDACQSWCTHAYMLTPQMARSLLERYSNEWLQYHSDFGYMKFAPEPPVLGYKTLHDHTHPRWRGLFFQARKASWYERGMSENGHGPL